MRTEHPFSLASSPTSLPRLSGNLVTGGADLPRIAGRMERLPGGNSAFRFRMDDYAAGTSRLGIPEMYIAQGRDGSLGFSGAVTASGPLPGGSVQGLRLPVNGSFAANGAVRMQDELSNHPVEAHHGNIALPPYARVWLA